MKKKHLLMLAIAAVLSFSANFCFAQGVGINATGAAADTSAMLDIVSTTKGVLVPRMTNSARGSIVLPANGLLIYQTDGTPGFYYNSGTSASPVWTAVSGGAPTGTAGGNLGGTYPNPSIASLPAISGASLTTLNASNISSGTVGTARLGTGTANSSSFLRGDQTWQPVSSGGATLDLVAWNTTSTTVATASTITVVFNNVATTPTVGSYNSSTGTYTVGAAGTYLVIASIAGSGNAAVSPVIVVNGTVITNGPASNSLSWGTYQGRGEVMMVMSLASSDALVIKGSNGNSLTNQPLSTDGTTRLTITKL